MTRHETRATRADLVFGAATDAITRTVFLASWATRARKRVTLILVLLVTVLVGGATAAAAFDSPACPGYPGGNLNTSGCGTEYRWQNYVPLERWGAATGSVVTRSDADATADWGDKVQGVSTSGQLAVAQALWGLTAKVTSWVSSWAPADMLTEPVDTFTATLGTFVLSSALLVVLVVALVLATLWNIRRRKGGWGPLLRGVAVVAVLAVIVAGASTTRTTYSTPDSQGVSRATTTPGTFSPTWITGTATSITGTIVGPAVTKIQDTIKNNSSGFPTASGNGGYGTDPFSCTAYLKALDDLAEANYMPKGVAVTVASAPIYQLSGIWQQSGLQIWKQYQVGTTSIGDNVWCHLLDDRSGLSWAEKQEVLLKAAEGTGTADVIVADGTTLRDLIRFTSDESNLATNNMRGSWADNSGTDQNDVVRATVAWAACTVDANGFKVRDSWKGVREADKDRGEVTVDQCQAFFGVNEEGFKEKFTSWWPESMQGGALLAANLADAFTGGAVSAIGGNGFILDESAFDIDEKDADIDEAAALAPPAHRAEVGDFLSHLYGSVSGAGLDGTSGLFAIIAGLVGLGVFGLLGLLILINGIIVVISTLAMLAALVAYLIPGPLGDGVLPRWGKTFFGALLLTSGYSAILALVGLLSTLFIGFMPLSGSPSVASLALTAFAPLLSVLSVKFVMGRVFGKGNGLLSLKGAAAVAGLGGAAYLGGKALGKVKDAATSGRTKAMGAVRNGFTGKGANPQDVPGGARGQARGTGAVDAQNRAAAPRVAAPTSTVGAGAANGDTPADTPDGHDPMARHRAIAGLVRPRTAQEARKNVRAAREIHRPGEEDRRERRDAAEQARLDKRLRDQMAARGGALDASGRAQDGLAVAGSAFRTTAAHLGDKAKDAVADKRARASQEWAAGNRTRAAKRVLGASATVAGSAAVLALGAGVAGGAALAGAGYLTYRGAGHVYRSATGQEARNTDAAYRASAQRAVTDEKTHAARAAVATADRPYRAPAPDPARTPTASADAASLREAARSTMRQIGEQMQAATNGAARATSTAIREGLRDTRPGPRREDVRIEVKPLPGMPTPQPTAPDRTPAERVTRIEHKTTQRVERVERTERVIDRSTTEQGTARHPDTGRGKHAGGAQ